MKTRAPGENKLANSLKRQECGRRADLKQRVAAESGGRRAVRLRRGVRCAVAGGIRRCFIQSSYRGDSQGGSTQQASAALLSSRALRTLISRSEKKRERGREGDKGAAGLVSPGGRRQRPQSASTAARSHGRSSRRPQLAEAPRL